MEMSTNSIEQQLIAWVSSWTEMSVQPDFDLFLEIGLDSLHYAELISKLEVQLGIEFDFSSLSDWESVRTIRGITKFVVNNLEGLD